MTGTKCASCHINPTGGQMLTEYGLSFSNDKIPLESSLDSDFTFVHKISESISIGGDYRTQFIAASSPSSTVTTFHSMNLSLYGSVALSKKSLLYYSNDIVNNSYEVFSLLKVLPNSGYIKAGAFLPNYGWRLDDHSSYIRGGDLGFLPGLPFTFGNIGLPFVPNYKDIGIEVGHYWNNIFITLGMYNGTGNSLKINFDNDKAFNGKIEYMSSIADLNYRVGASGYRFKKYQLGGFNAGISSGNIVFLSEVDWTQGQFNSYGSTIVDEKIKTMAFYSELDIQLIQGLWAIGKFDKFDPVQGIKDIDTIDTSINQFNSKTRISFGLEVFINNFIELHPQFRINLEKPDIENNQFLLLTHIWF